MDTLPGCNPVSPTVTDIPKTCALAVPESFTPSVYEGAAAPPGAQVVAGTSPVLTAYKSWSYVDCYLDAASVRALNNGLSTNEQTVEACLDAAAAKGFTHAGVECKGP